MTSVPKPLKFLRPHLQTFKDQYPTIKDATNKKLLADVISVLSMTDSPGENVIPESLKYKMLGSGEEVGFWGHEYARNLASEIGIEYHRRADLEEGEEGVTAKDKEVDDLMKLVKDIVPFHMSHNAEPEAVDLLIEVEKLEYLIDHVTENNYSRTCLYLISCSSYLPEPEDGIVLSTAHKIFMKVNKLCDAMRVALKIGVQSTIEETFLASKDPLEKKQLCYILARHGHPLKLDEGPCEQEGDDAEELTLIMSNSKLCENYLTLARDLDVMEAKLPEDIYKTHLIEGRAPSGPAVDSARANLAATFVNAFVNAGFGHDKLLTGAIRGRHDWRRRLFLQRLLDFQKQRPRQNVRSCEFRICVAVGRRRWFTASGYVFVFRRAVSRCWWSPRRRFDQHEREKRLRSSLRSALRIRQQR